MKYASQEGREQVKRMAALAGKKLKGKIRSEEEKKKISEGTKAAMQSEEVKHRIVEGQKRRVLGYKQRAAQRESQRKEKRE